MKKQRFGRLLFTASSAGPFGGENTTSYAAAKSGLIGVMRATAIEGAPFGIRFNIIMPAAATRMQGEPVSYMSRIQAAIGRTGTERVNATSPDFVAPLAAYLVSESCAHTGSIFTAAVGCFAQVFLGLTPGWIGPSQHPAAVPDIDAHVEDVVAGEGFVIPDHPVAEFETIADALDRQGAGARVLNSFSALAFLSSVVRKLGVRQWRV